MERDEGKEEGRQEGEGDAKENEMVPSCLIEFNAGAVKPRAVQRGERQL